jgi:hypothetical protein
MIRLKLAIAKEPDHEANHHTQVLQAWHSFGYDILEVKSYLIAMPETKERIFTHSSVRIASGRTSLRQ